MSSAGACELSSDSSAALSWTVEIRGELRRSWVLFVEVKFIPSGWAVLRGRTTGVAGAADAGGSFSFVAGGGRDVEARDMSGTKTAAAASVSVILVPCDAHAQRRRLEALELDETIISARAVGLLSQLTRRHLSRMSALPPYRPNSLQFSPPKSSSRKGKERAVDGPALVSYRHLLNVGGNSGAANPLRTIAHIDM